MAETEVAPQLIRDARYRKAMREFVAACDAWHATGVPDSGPVFDRVIRARDELWDVIGARK